MPVPDPHPDGTCVITGASAGIGAAIAAELAGRGHGVTLVARREDRLGQLAEQLSEEHGVRVETVVADVSEPADRERVRREVAERGLVVEALVNNAGFGSGGAFVGLDGAKEAAMVRTNVEAVVALSSTYLPEMVERRRGAVLNLSSLSAFQPVPFQATYGATKAFLLHFTEAVHEELRGSGVTITAVCPGPVRTEFGEAGGFGGAEDGIPGFLWMSARRVAKAAIDGLERGDRVVVPGRFTRAAAVSGQHMPRAVLLPLVRRGWPVS